MNLFETGERKNSRTAPDKINDGTHGVKVLLRFRHSEVKMKIPKVAFFQFYFYFLFPAFFPGNFMRCSD